MDFPPWSISNKTLALVPFGTELWPLNKHTIRRCCPATQCRPSSSEEQSVGGCLGQGSSSLGVPKNRLRGLLKQRFLGSIPEILTEEV